jgi:hypothetical protein
MKNFIFGLLAGLVIASSFVFLDSNPTEPPAEVVTYLLDNKSKEESNIQANDEGKFSQNALREPTRQVKSNQKSAADNRRNNENTEGSQERARIEKILEGLNDEDLKRVESMVSRLNEKSPSEKFAVESIDAEWSLTKQAELEYSFYESSSLRDLGNLDSVICKSQSCQVKVSIPSDLNLRPSHFMDWSNPVATTLMPHQEDPDSKTLVIYIKR